MVVLCETVELRLPAERVVGGMPVACSRVLEGEERVAFSTAAVVGPGGWGCVCGEFGCCGCIWVGWGCSVCYLDCGWFAWTCWRDGSELGWWKSFEEAEEAWVEGLREANVLFYCRHPCRDWRGGGRDVSMDFDELR